MPSSAGCTVPFRALIFDSLFAFIIVREGAVQRGQRFRTFHGQREYEVSEVGIMHLGMTPCTVRAGYG